MSQKEIFEQAEQERIKGSDRKASELYEQLINHPGEYQVPAKHMLGVVYRVMQRPEDSQRLLKELLDNEDLQPLKRAHILRDYGDALRNSEKYPEAQSALQESLRLFREHGGSSDEQAATLGFLSRNLAQQKKYNEALPIAKGASELFLQGENRHTRLYHEIFRARLLALAGQPDEAKKLSESLENDAKTYGKDVHVNRLRTIREHADDPEAMEAAIKQSREPGMS